MEEPIVDFRTRQEYEGPAWKHFGAIRFHNYDRHNNVGIALAATKARVMLWEPKDDPNKVLGTDPRYENALQKLHTILVDRVVPLEHPPGAKNATYASPVTTLSERYEELYPAAEEKDPWFHQAHTWRYNDVQRVLQRLRVPLEEVFEETSGVSALVPPAAFPNAAQDARWYSDVDFQTPCWDPRDPRNTKPGTPRVFVPLAKRDNYSQLYGRPEPLTNFGIKPVRSWGSGFFPNTDVRYACCYQPLGSEGCIIDMPRAREPESYLYQWFGGTGEPSPENMELRGVAFKETAEFDALHRRIKALLGPNLETLQTKEPQDFEDVELKEMARVAELIYQYNNLVTPQGLRGFPRPEEIPAKRVEMIRYLETVLLKKPSVAPPFSSVKPMEPVVEDKDESEEVPGLPPRSEEEGEVLDEFEEPIPVVEPEEQGDVQQTKETTTKETSESPSVSEGGTLLPAKDKGELSPEESFELPQVTPSESEKETDTRQTPIRRLPQESEEARKRRAEEQRREQEALEEEQRKEQEALEAQKEEQRKQRETERMRLEEIEKQKILQAKKKTQEEKQRKAQEETKKAEDERKEQERLARVRQMETGTSKLVPKEKEDVLPSTPVKTKYTARSLQQEIEKLEASKSKSEKEVKYLTYLNTFLNGYAYELENIKTFEDFDAERDLNPESTPMKAVKERATRSVKIYGEIDKLLRLPENASEENVKAHIEIFNKVLDNIGNLEPLGLGEKVGNMVWIQNNKRDWVLNCFNCNLLVVSLMRNTCAYINEFLIKVKDRKKTDAQIEQLKMAAIGDYAGYMGAVEKSKKQQNTPVKENFYH